MENAWRQIIHRDTKANKYDFGHVLVIGGSDGMEGAPMLVAEAAMRVGAGLATIASTAEVVNRIAGDIEEVMTRAILSSDIEESCWEMLEFIEQRSVKAVVIGSGMDEKMHELIRRLLPKLTIPTIVDAGALRALGGEFELVQEMAQQNKRLILTPHTGEFADLLQKDTVDQLDAQNFAAEYGMTVVLKGNPTYIATPQQMHKNTTGTPALATAGTGDVLAGVIAGFLAQGIEVGEAAKMATYVQGLAGTIAAQVLTEAGVLAGDVIAALPSALERAAEL